MRDENVHGVGHFINECERKVVEHLKHTLPDTFHVYYNLELVSKQGGHPFEVDVLVIGEATTWVLEVKGYHGPIRGNAMTWLLPNGKSEKSPIPLVNLKARILAGRIHRYAPMLDNYYTDALVVLCDNHAKIELQDPQSDRVVRLHDLSRRMLEVSPRKLKQIKSEQGSQLVREMLDQWFKPLTAQPSIGDYILEGTAVSVGRYSQTYRAHHRLLEAIGRVSLKIYRLDPMMSGNTQKRWRNYFLHEAEALHFMSHHPNIGRCYAPFEWEEDLLVVPLEWVDGPTLRNCLEAGLNWPLNRRLEVFQQLCKGLAHAHSGPYKITHRAVSPDNVIVPEIGPVKLVNFNMAKMERGNSLSTGFWNHPDKRYRAPEQVRNVHQGGPGVDIYSAGVTLYELLTGHCPFSKGQEHLPPEQIPPPSRLNPEASSELDKLFCQMCQLDPSQRLPSFEEVLLAIPKS